ncbi:hypothetical protein CORC01_10841 [Colletotrichum orchidophilum]|uniref:Nuclear pore protein n=1 Tax=Colletotrichum orchidophilum TaxID=1209926 RepID=A0A1G4AXD3_9PEZI|nr:uncharacterized protein CORC01_10841 [Colletotrichum orchidophilum]OHE93820.1 hypothetical protein CORC01_10841 [Colletotrichum orchidophilum]
MDALPSAGDGDADGGFPNISETQVDPDGDLILLAGQQTEDPEGAFRVCASALRRSSQVWEKMLFGPFEESKPAFGIWLVNLPKDNPGALEIILNIIHANFPLVPNSPSLFELYEVFQLANKYDMISALQPWAVAWSNVAESDAAVTDGLSVAALAYVSWELGHVELHREMMGTLLLQSSLDKDGRMITSDGVVLDDFEPIGPPSHLGNFNSTEQVHTRANFADKKCLEFLRRQQRDIFRTLPLQLNSVIRELTGGQGCCVDETGLREEKAACNNIILGSLLRGMARARGMISLTLTGNADESVADFAEVIRSIAEHISTYAGHRDRCSPIIRISDMSHKLRKGRIVNLTKNTVDKMEKRRAELKLSLN